MRLDTFAQEDRTLCFWQQQQGDGSTIVKQDTQPLTESEKETVDERITPRSPL